MESKFILVKSNLVNNCLNGGRKGVPKLKNNADKKNSALVKIIIIITPYTSFLHSPSSRKSKTNRKAGTG